MWNMILVSVVGNEVQIVARDKNVRIWVQKSLKNYRRTVDPKIDKIATSKISVNGFKDSKNATQYASRLIRFLVSNGWREVSYNDYVCGHWYQKKL